MRIQNGHKVNYEKARNGMKRRRIAKKKRKKEKKKKIELYEDEEKPKKKKKKKSQKREKKKRRKRLNCLKTKMCCELKQKTNVVSVSTMPQSSLLR